jgi:hypothetical protein
MPKKFNITGLCLPARHYMADISEKLRLPSAVCTAHEEHNS